MTDRPANQTEEIEITPAMLQAGICELLHWVAPDDLQISLSDLSVALYSAMALARANSVRSRAVGSATASPNSSASVTRSIALT